MNKVKIGIIFGILAGVIDVIPMLVQKLTWDANLSAFFFWVVAGFFVAITDVKIKGARKGVILSFLLLIPTAFLIGWNNPLALIPVIIMNLILGFLLGFFIEKYGRQK